MLLFDVLTFVHVLASYSLAFNLRNFCNFFLFFCYDLPTSFDLCDWIMSARSMFPAMTAIW